jgi:type I restriction enzyme S subunit
MDSLMQMPRYEDYRDSGVKVLGEMPEHWEVKRLKFEDNINMGQSPNSEDCNVDQIGVPFLQGNAEFGSTHPTPKLWCTKPKKIANKGDVLLSVRAPVGALNFADQIYSIGRGLTAITSLKSALTFKVYQLSCAVDGLKILSTGSTFEAVSVSDVCNMVVLIPPLPEQADIAAFLDRKTTQIDQAVAIKEKQIALLKERKQILIQNAVTRGLDPNVPMKDSGVGWIGEIPEHWEIKRLRFLGKTQNGISAGAEYFGTGYPFVSYGDVYNNRELPCSVKGLANSTEEDRRQYSVQNGDVLFTRTSETVEEIGFASVCMQTIENSTFAGFLIRFRPKLGTLFDGFTKYYFNSDMLRDYFVKEMNLVTRASLSQELLKDLPVLLPPINEQERIYTFLESESGKIDKTANFQLLQIDKLKEYKSTLINSAVTGKIKVA